MARYRCMPGCARPATLALALLAPLDLAGADDRILDGVAFRTAGSLEAPVGSMGRMRLRADADARRAGAHFLPATLHALRIGVSVGELPATLPGHGRTPKGWRAGVAFEPGIGASEVRLGWFRAGGGGDGPVIMPDRRRVAEQGLLLEVRRPLGRGPRPR